MTLTLEEAAERLGVTPELLRAYTGKGMHRVLPGGTPLRCVEVKGGHQIEPGELDAFDCRLRGPWADRTAPRPEIPSAIRDYLKVECGGQCALCGAADQLENAHLDKWEASRSHHHHNIIRLCARCHGRYDTGSIGRAEVFARKRELVEQVRRVSRQRRSGRETGAFDPPTIGQGFVGRAKEIASVTDALREGRSVLICGVGGIGKSQLALHSLVRMGGDRLPIWVRMEANRSAADLVATFQAAVTGLGAGPSSQITTALEEMGAIVIIDGLESAHDELDAICDLIGGLLASTREVRFIVTSRLALPALRFHRIVRLTGLPPSLAEDILAEAIPPSVDDVQGVEYRALRQLNRFADGHPLTLKVMAALIAHFRFPTAVCDRLARFGSAAVRTPGRTLQSSTTSLEACLRLTFDLLGAPERRMCWVAVNSPAGFLQHSLDGDLLGFDDLEAAIAELDRHCLIETEGPSGNQLVRMLTPVRAFLKSAFVSSPPTEIEDLEHALAASVAGHVLLLDSRLLRSGRVEGGMGLLERELPNAVRAIEIAASRVDSDSRMQKVLSTFAASLMIFLFSSGRFGLGVEIMRRAATAAQAAGDVDDAVQTIAQLQTLAERAGDDAAARQALAEAEALIGSATGSALATLHLIRASAAETAGDYDAAEKWSREAIAILRDEDDYGERHKLASALFSCGRALEFADSAAAALPVLEEALEIYKRDLDPINLGSSLHHIGNCRDAVGDHAGAFAAYLEAAYSFQKIGAVEFLSNALGEAGLVLATGAWPSGMDWKVEPGLIADGFDDAISELEVRALTISGRSNFIMRLKKLGGIIALASFVDGSEVLDIAADQLYERVVSPLANSGSDREEHGVLLFQTQYIVRLLQLLAKLKNTRANGSRIDIKDRLALVCLTALAFCGPLEGQMFAWLATFLSRRLGFERISPQALVGEARNAEAAGFEHPWLI